MLIKRLLEVKLLVHAIPAFSKFRQKIVTLIPKTNWFHF